MSNPEAMTQLTEAEAITRCAAGGFVWDDELPEPMRGFGVPALFRGLMVDPSSDTPG